MPTFEQQYVQWVQRTLNRELDAELVTNGATSPEYREAVETFQLVNDLAVNGQVGSADQNKMIKVNHQSKSYINWAQEALHEVGARERAAVTGIMDKDTTDSIKSFQAFHKLKDDGWIGAKTEIELIDGSGLLPPGHIKAAGPVPRRPKRFFYDNPRPKPLGLPVDRAVTRVISTNYYDAFYNRSALSAGDRRRRLCVLGKLKQRHGIDDQFPVDAYLGYAYHGSTVYRTVASIFASAREYLSDRVSSWRAEDRLDPVKGRLLIRDLMKEIDSGLRAIERYQKLYKPSSSPAFPALLEAVAKSASERKRKSTSILSCYG
jgi:peptidoglycan hydrolase-like protein with peptidoglycan-binding domain